MEQVKNQLEERKKQLLKIKKAKEKALSTAPEGSLRLCSHGGRTQYYHRTDPKDFNGVYIREKDFKLARKLAQKDYDKKVLDSVGKELKAIEKYLTGYPARNAEQIYESLHRARRELITPIIEPEEEFIHNWESVKYQGKEFYDDMPEFYTSRNERVRSKSEVMIADALNREGIPYRYEYPMLLKGVGTIYPDFTALNVRTREEWYWEHLGMMDDPDYVEIAVQKISAYELNGVIPGVNLILTYETRKNPLNQKMVMLLIQKFLK